MNDENKQKIEQWTIVQEGKPDFTFTIKTIEDDENGR